MKNIIPGNILFVYLLFICLFIFYFLAALCGMWDLNSLIRDRNCALCSGSAESFFLIIYFIYLFLAVLDLRCCAQAFSSCGERGLLFIAVHGLLIAVASLVTEHRL